MSRQRRHGRRRGVVAGCGCTVKAVCFSTYEAGMSSVARLEDCERVYRGPCCGHYHLTSLTQDEFAQRVADFTDAEREAARPSPLDVGRIVAARGVHEHESDVR